MSAQPKFTNRLIDESSPYLRQHAHNPVDWYPWGEEALARARQLDRPIFLSVGYSACHWCHVMEHESFEDEEVAQLLNDHFVSVKVDREERPDLDQIYMAAVQLMNHGQGGWPMSVFLTPDLRPFTGGTYFPPEDKFGRPGFKRVLRTIAGWWRDQRAKLEEAAAGMVGHMAQLGQLEPSDGDLSENLLRGAVAQLARTFDPRDGGFGQAPKFPHAMDLRFLLRAWHRFGDGDALHMARHTLEKMAAGGIYDHLGGGFARYSTDARWLVPHFEKMLYDNALLVPVYAEAFQITGDPALRTVVEETLGWVEREMVGDAGGFYSTLDADSEGEEGKFYVWSQEELNDLLGVEEAAVFAAYYGVQPGGNWEGHNILHRTRSPEAFARHHQMSESDLEARLAKGRAVLFAARSKRVWPGLDDKSLTSWNGLMIGAFAVAARILGEPRFAAVASRAADFVLATLRTPEGRLLRTCSPGRPAKLNAYLEDYAYLIDGLVSLYEATFDPRWVLEALALADVMVEQFWDEADGGFFFTGRDHEALISRTKDPHDNATPSGNAMAVTGLLRLVKLTGRDDLFAKAETTLRLYAKLLAEHPMAASQMLIALDFYRGPVQEVAIVGDPASEAVGQVRRLLEAKFQPRRVLALKPTDNDVGVALLHGKTAQGDVTLYLCENFACQAPFVGVEAIAKAI